MTATRTKKLAVIAMLAALSYVIMVFVRIPVLTVPPFLRYEPKDVIITIGGFLFGPLSALAISLVVSFFEMITVSETGFIGALMNLVSSCAFACTAAAVYKRNRNMTGAAVALISGLVAMVAAMLLWNYVMTPIFLGYPREAVAEMLIPIFLPFNLLKGGLNAGITILLYKPVKKALVAARFLPESGGEKTKTNIGMMLVAIFIVITGILLILAYQGIL